MTKISRSAPFTKFYFGDQINVYGRRRAVARMGEENWMWD